MTDITLIVSDGKDYLLYSDGYTDRYYPIKKNGLKWSLPEFDKDDEPSVIEAIVKFHKRSVSSHRSKKLTRNSDGSLSLKF